MIKSLAVILIILSFENANAKVFDFTKSSFVTYLRGAYGINKVQKYAFEPGFPSTVTFPDHLGVNQTYSADFGIGFSTGRTVTRVGVELMYPQLVKELSGVNSGGSSLLVMTSEVFAVMPKLSFEYALKQSQEFRLFVGFSGGYGPTTVKNTVNLTPTGLGFFSGTGAGANYTEEASGYSIMAEVYSGLEFAFFDNTSFSLDLGYHYHPITALSVTRNANTVRGPITIGSTLLNSAGGNRSVDLSGYFVGGTLRIYIR